MITVLQTDVLQLCVVGVPPTLYEGATLAWSEARVQQSLSQTSLSGVPAAVCIKEVIDSNHSSLFPAGLPLVFCSHSVLTGVCTPGLLFVCCMTLWIINEGNASPKLKNREPEIDKNERVRGLSAGSAANT